MSNAPAIIVTAGITAMLSKTLIDLVTNMQLGREEWQENKKLCFYCQASTVAATVAAVLAVPETVRAIKTLLGKALTHQ